MPGSIFDVPPFVTERAAYLARLKRYQSYRAYYAGTAYDTNQFIRQNKQLYAGTRTLFSPLRRVVNVDVAKVPADWALNPDEVSTATIERVRLLRQLTKAESAYHRFLLYGAVAGESALLLSGEPSAPTLTAFRPDEAHTFTAADGVPYGLIIKQQRDANQPYEYAMVITPATIRTYKNGVLFSYDGAPAEQMNAFGFVPLMLSHFVTGEDGHGEPAFAGVLELLDRVNEMASLTLDVMARNAEPVVVGTGVTSIERDPDSDALLIENEHANMFTVDPKLSIEETLHFIQDVRGEFKMLLPQLHLDDLRGLSDLAYDTVQTLLMELGDHIIAVRGCVDLAVEQVERWLLQANGGVPDDYALWRDRRWITLSEMQQLDLESKRLDVQLKQRSLVEPVVPGELSTYDRQSATGTQSDARTAERSSAGRRFIGG